MALENQCDLFLTECNMDVLNDGWTIPSLTMKYVFKSALKNQDHPWLFVSLPEQNQAEYHNILRKQMVGGTLYSIYAAS